MVQWTDAKKEAASFNSKVMNAIFNVRIQKDFKCRDSTHYLEYPTNCA